MLILVFKKFFVPKSIKNRYFLKIKTQKYKKKSINNNLRWIKIKKSKQYKIKFQICVKYINKSFQSKRLWS